MKAFIIKQINLAIRTLKECVVLEKKDSVIYYRQMKFDIAFSNIITILTMLIELSRALPKEDYYKYKDLKKAIKHLEGAISLINLTEKNGKVDGRINYYQHKLDIDLKDIYTVLNKAIEQLESNY